jgi:FKBP-type peptidyl-prolyl cis-trans isomerase FkpA
LKNVQTTASGLRYIVEKEGDGKKPAVGTKVTMNYTGMFLDDKKFDSNVDPSFNHVQPFNFDLGKGQVIKGWDEGVALMSKGAKYKLIIPSGMAYGSQERGGIPANSILVFDVELVDF